MKIDFVEKLKYYLENTPDDQIKKDWENIEQIDNMLTVLLKQQTKKERKKEMEKFFKDLDYGLDALENKIDEYKKLKNKIIQLRNSLIEIDIIESCDVEYYNNGEIEVDIYVNFIHFENMDWEERGWYEDLCSLKNYELLKNVCSDIDFDFVCYDYETKYVRFRYIIKN
jgi:hypothetical protein